MATLRLPRPVNRGLPPTASNWILLLSVNLRNGGFTRVPVRAGDFELNGDVPPVCLVGTIIFAIMASQRRRLFALTLVFICLVSHRCFAGPLPQNWPCILREKRFQFPNVFASPAIRFARSSQPPTMLFQWARFSLTRITAPPEFRGHDSKAKRRALDVLQTRPWPPPCPVRHGPLTL